MKYERHRLLVWPEWESSGIWHPSGPVQEPGPVAMVEYGAVTAIVKVVSNAARCLHFITNAIPRVVINPIFRIGVVLTVIHVVWATRAFTNFLNCT